MLSKQKFSEKYKHKNMKYLTLKYTFLFSKQTEVSFEDQKKFVQFITSSRLAGLVKYLRWKQLCTQLSDTLPFVNNYVT